MIKAGSRAKNARDIVARHIRAVSARGQELDLIFCANDEMASVLLTRYTGKRPLAGNSLIWL
jgi:hypothetical protein